MVKEIPLTKGQTAIVDDDVFDMINHLKWYARECGYGHFYAVRATYVDNGIGKKKFKAIYMHRLIMAAPRDMVVDHVNGNSLDNRKENLRLCSHRQNMQNSSKNGTSKYVGVSWNGELKKWRSRITINGKNKHLGYFVDEREAAMAYERACRELFGEELVCKLEKR